MGAEFILVSIDINDSIKQQELANKSQFFERAYKIRNFVQNEKGAP